MKIKQNLHIVLSGGFVDGVCGGWQLRLWKLFNSWRNCLNCLNYVTDYDEVLIKVKGVSDVIIFLACVGEGGVHELIGFHLT